MFFDILIKVAIAMLVFVPLEHVLPRRKDKKVFRSLWKMDAVYALLGGCVLTLCSIVFLTGSLVALYPFIPEAVRSFTGSLPLLIQVIGFMLIADLGYYAMHRLCHTVPFLWRFHAIHHSIEDMDWLAAHRVHPLDQLLTRTASMMVPLALGASTEALAIWVFIFNWHSLLKHSNVNINFGPLRWIFVSPVFHHWHHANEQHAYDRNFAGQFSFLDQLFGTAIMTEKEQPKQYGVDDPLPEGYLKQLIAPLQKQYAPATESEKEVVPTAVAT